MNHLRLVCLKEKCTDICVRRKTFFWAVAIVGGIFWLEDGQKDSKKCLAKAIRVFFVYLNAEK